MDGQEFGTDRREGPPWIIREDSGYYIIHAWNGMWDAVLNDGKQLLWRWHAYAHTRDYSPYPTCATCGVESPQKQMICQRCADAARHL
jgi:hypothetical protein